MPQPAHAAAASLPVPLTKDDKCDKRYPECYQYGLDANGHLTREYYSKQETTPDGKRFYVVRVSDGDETTVAYESKDSLAQRIAHAFNGKKVRANIAILKF